MAFHGTNIADLRSLITRALAASNELSARIEEIRADNAAGIPLPANKVILMERSNKDMTKDLVARLVKIENLPEKTAADREMEQALNARLYLCDLHAARLATLRDLEHSLRGGGEFLGPEVVKKPKGGSSKKKAKESGHDSSDTREQDNELVEELSIGRGHSSDGEDEDGDEREEPEVDKSAWPLLYRILDVDPDTWQGDFQKAADSALKKLALKHSPKSFPNDPDAPERWKAVMKAYSTLTNIDSKRFYDMHEKVPAELQDFDLSRLSLK